MVEVRGVRLRRGRRLHTRVVGCSGRKRVVALLVHVRQIREGKRGGMVILCHSARSDCLLAWVLGSRCKNRVGWPSVSEVVLSMNECMY